MSFGEGLSFIDLVMILSYSQAVLQLLRKYKAHHLQVTHDLQFFHRSPDEARTASLQNISLQLLASGRETFMKAQLQTFPKAAIRTCC